MILSDNQQDVVWKGFPLAGLKEFQPRVGEMVSLNVSLGTVQSVSAFSPSKFVEKRFQGVCVARWEDAILVASGGVWKVPWSGVPLVEGMKVTFAIYNGMYDSGSVMWTSGEGIGKVKRRISDSLVEVEFYQGKEDLEGPEDGHL